MDNVKQGLIGLLNRQIKYKPDFDYKTAKTLIDTYTWDNEHLNGSIAFCIEQCAYLEKPPLGQSPFMVNEYLHCALRYLHGVVDMELELGHHFFSVSKISPKSYGCPKLTSGN